MTQFFLDPILLDRRFFGHGLFWIKNFLDPIFLTKTTTTTTTTTLIGFDTIEINLVGIKYQCQYKGAEQGFCCRMVKILSLQERQAGAF